MSAIESSAESRDVSYATFAGGCFWCMQPPYDKLKGVISTTVGYTGGQFENPSYEQVSGGGTGHAEAVQIEFDSKVTSYQELLDIFWRNIDPTVKDRQFCDVGKQYRTAIFYHDEEQKRQALESKEQILKSGVLKDRVIHTEIVPAEKFYRAEDYHQEYYKKNPLRYNIYKSSCERENRLEELWGSK